MIAGRSTERFFIPGIGTVYEIKLSRNADLRKGDILLDLMENHFCIKAIEHILPMFANREWQLLPEKRTLGLLIERIKEQTGKTDQQTDKQIDERIDHTDMAGTILFTDKKDIEKFSFLFCNHPLYPQKVDEDYQNEYQIASLNYPCALFSYEDLEKGKLSLYGDKISGMVIYRGWMMKPELYRTFYHLLEKAGIYLINSPEEYEKYHLLPEWYKDFENQTAKSVWEKEGNLGNAMQMSRNLTGPYLVKDYVKSRKHEWYDACYIVGNCIERQGDNLVGGVVLRKFEKLKQIGFHEKSGMPLSEEYRVFLFAGQVLNAGNYWTDKMGKSEEHLSEKEWKWIKNVAKTIKSNFVTMDLARRENGELMIMEFGDGQVSGLQQIDPGDFYQAFKNFLK